MQLLTQWILLPSPPKRFIRFLTNDSELFPICYISWNENKSKWNCYYYGAFLQKATSEREAKEFMNKLMIEAARPALLSIVMGKKRIV